MKNALSKINIWKTDFSEISFLRNQFSQRLIFPKSILEKFNLLKDGNNFCQLQNKTKKNNKKNVSYKFKEFKIGYVKIDLLEIIYFKTLFFRIKFSQKLKYGENRFIQMNHWKFDFFEILSFN